MLLFEQVGVSAFYIGALDGKMTAPGLKDPMKIPKSVLFASDTA